MDNGPYLLEWAREQAISLLPLLGNRWLHVQSVVEQARWVSQIFDEPEQTSLIAAAYLHDIAYAPALQQTGFHPIDGARYLRSHEQERLACLVAYHSGAQYEARFRGLTEALQQFTHEHSPLADALDYCDMTTGPAGERLTFEQRIADIFHRYDEAHIVNQAMHQAESFLSLSVERTKQALQKHNINSE